MNNDFRVNVNFLNHHKTKLLRKRLGYQGIVALLGLWSYAAQCRPDGALDGMNAEAIEAAVDWNADQSLVQTLVDIGFLDLDDTGEYRLHDWHEHNPWAAEAEERGDEARLARLFRTNAEKAKELKAQGRTGITSDEYQEFKTPAPKYDRTTPVLRPQYDRSTDRSTPAPAPAPDPEKEKQGNQEERAATTLAGARARALGGGEKVRKNGTPIPADWFPGEPAYDVLVGLGIPRPFAESCIPEFRLYWTERGEVRPGWEACFVNSVKRSWDKRPRDTKVMGQRRPGQTIAERITEEHDIILGPTAEPDPFSCLPKPTLPEPRLIEGEVLHGRH